MSTASNLIAKIVSSEDSYYANASSFTQEIKKDNGAYVNALLAIVIPNLKTLKELKSTKEPTKIYLCLRLLKDSMDTNSIKLAQELNTDRTILKKMEEIAKFDAKNPDPDRGRDIFGGKEKDVGIMYLKLILECIYHWQRKFTSPDKTPTVFSDVYETLLKSKVTFPKPDDFLFFIPKPKKKAIESSSQINKNPPKNSTPTGFDNPGQDKHKLVNEKLVIQDQLRQIVESLQLTVLLNDEPSQIVEDSLPIIVNEMTQIEKKYINFIQEAYQNPDLFTENDNNKFLEENEFLSAMIEEINIQMKKKTLDSFKRFSSNAAKLIQKTFGIATQTPKDPHLSDSHNIKKNFEKSSPSYFPEPRETFKPNDNKKGSQNEYHFQEPSFKPNSNEFGTFGGNDNKSGSAFQDFQSNEPKQDSFKAFGGGFDDGFKKVDTEAFQNNVEWGTNNSNLKGSGSGFDEFGLKTSKITHQNFEPIPEKIIKPALTNKSKLKRSSDAKDFDHEEPFSSRSGHGKNIKNDQLNDTKKMVFDNHPQNMYNQQNMSSQQNMHTQQNMYNSKQDNVIHSNVQQSKTKNKVNESQRSYMFPESDIFEEKFDNLSVSTVSVRDFPFKNKILKDPQRKTPGKLIPYSPQLFNLEYLKDNQSNLRKFKQACLKNRCPLFEIPNLQIGVLTSTFFDIASSKNYLKLSIYYGNKSKYSFDQFSVDYTGDFSFSLWLRNEEIIDESKVGTIPGKSQIKHEMVINYNSTPFTLIMAEIEMKILDERLSFPVYLPLLMTKFFVLKASDNKIFKFKWRIKKEYRLRTDIFAINPKVLRHPSYLKRYFPECCELTSMKDFVSQTKDSENLDYKVGLVFELNKPDIEYLIKIILRPNMTMYVQIASPPNYTLICEYILQNLYFIFSK